MDSLVRKVQWDHGETQACQAVMAYTVKREPPDKMDYREFKVYPALENTALLDPQGRLGHQGRGPLWLTPPTC